MSKFSCPCGAVIRDQSDKLAYKGWILADAQIDEFCDGLGVEIRAKILQDPTLPSDSIGDLVHSALVTYCRDAYQCEHCGRLHVQRIAAAPQFATFLPDNDDWKHWFLIDRSTTERI